MANQYVNKVIYGNDTLVDLTGDTAEAGDVLLGKTFHLKSGLQSSGTLDPALKPDIAPVEASATTSQAYAVGSYLYYNSTLYMVTSAIAQGGTIITSGAGQNVTDVTVGSRLNTLSSDLANKQPTYTADSTAWDTVPTKDSTKPVTSGGVCASLSNPNLLDNSWFTVNQRGVSSFVGGSSWQYGFVDRWCCRNLTATLNNDNSVTLAFSGSGVQSYLQKLENSLVTFLTGKTCTLSVLYGDNSIYHKTFVFPSETTAIDIDSIHDVGFVFISGQGIDIRNNKTTAHSITVKAIKLELGSISTLAMDTIPDYASELLKCQRYFNRLASTNAFMGYMHSSSVARIILPTPVAMRARPSWTPSDVTGLQIMSGTTSQVLSSSQSLSWAGFTPQEFVVSISDLTSPFISGEFCMLKLNTSYIDLSADL